MKKILLAFVVLLLMTGISWAEVAQPILPVSFDKFELSVKNQWECGTLEVSRYEESATVVWHVAFLNRHQFVNALAVIRFTSTSQEYWLDKNRDGMFDEYYTNGEVVYQKYPTPCDAVK